MQNTPTTDLDYRSWGQTRNCHGCRFWSEMIAQATGADTSVKAMCIAPDGPYQGQYMHRRRACEKWQEGSLGAIDQPGGDPYEALGETP